MILYWPLGKFVEANSPNMPKAILSYAIAASCLGVERSDKDSRTHAFKMNPRCIMDVSEFISSYFDSDESGLSIGHYKLL